jgi:hypothetical protein
MAPEPLLPDGSTPEKDIKVIEEVTGADRVAFTDTLRRGVCEKARQISAVPSCVRVPTIRAHVKPAPETPFTVVSILEPFPAAIKASNSSPFEVVENFGEVIAELAVA